jgi:hypothetical protein
MLGYYAATHAGFQPVSGEHRQDACATNPGYAPERA